MKVAPVVTKVAPVVKKVAPIVKKVAPVVKKVAPVVNKFSPVVKKNGQGVREIVLKKHTRIEAPIFVHKLAGSWRAAPVPKPNTTKTVRTSS